MATADCTTSTHDEGDCCEEGLHSLSCSEDEDRGELVCTGLIFIYTAASQCSIEATVNETHVSAPLELPKE